MNMFNSRGLMLFLCILTIVQFTYCSSSTVTRSPSNSDNTSVTDQSDNQNVNLKLNLSEGDTYYLVSTLEQTMSMEMMGRQVETINYIRNGQDFHVDDVQGNIFSIRTTLADIAMKMEMAGGPSSSTVIDYDSKRPTNSNNPLKDIFATMVGESFSVRVTDTGKILETTGMEELMSKVIASAPGPVNQQLQNMISGDNMIQGLEQMFNIYPDGPVSLGDTWSIDQNISMGINLAITTIYTLNSRSNGISSLGVKGTLKTLPGSTMPGMESMNISMNMTGSSEGTVNISEDSGWIRDGLIIQNISGSMEMQNPNNPAMNMSIPMTMIMKTTFSSEKK